MIVVFILPLLLVALCAFTARRLLRYLHIFQQEEYDGKRFLGWIFATRGFDKRVTLALLLMPLLMLWTKWWLVGEILPAVALIVSFFLESDPRKVAKKKLVMTQRARRVFGIALALCLVVVVVALVAQIVVSLGFGFGVNKEVARVGIWFGLAIPLTVAVQFIPLSLVLANLILMPFESYIQKRIMREASAKLAQIKPQVIGITGSFGKTSVKHILGHILEMNAQTLYTPGSVNTLMGISRIIREKLLVGTQYFLVEMGAYGRGSIEKLCRLTPPQTGIITSLGEAHYERFKTLDAVAHAKFELAEAVLTHADGRLVIHEDVLAQDYARSFVEKQPEKFVICGQSDRAALKINSVTQSASGLTVEVVWQGTPYTLFAPLYGTHHAGNMALAFAAALVCGVEPERAVAALRTTPQITHRLEVKPQADGTIYVDDAFNSNPKGFASALELLTVLAAEKGGRRILITPGIVELGAKHDEAHQVLGAKAAQNVDVALVVRSDRIPTFVESFRASAPEKPLHCVANLIEARQWLQENAKAGDIFLIENDLPDMGEARLRL